MNVQTSLSGQSIESVIFDFDGVLVDSDELHCEAYRRAFERHGIAFSLADYQSHAKGRSRDQVIDFHAAALLPDERHEIAIEKGEEAMRLVSSGQLRAVEGVIDFISDLRSRGLPCAVASTSEIAALAIEAIGLRELFDCVCMTRTQERPKPYPDVFLRALDGISMPAESCLVIEDTPVGVRAALEAGTRVIVRGTQDAWRDEPVMAEVLGFFASYPELRARLDGERRGVSTD